LAIALVRREAPSELLERRLASLVVAVACANLREIVEDPTARRALLVERLVDGARFLDRSASKKHSRPVISRLAPIARAFFAPQERLTVGQLGFLIALERFIVGAQLVGAKWRARRADRGFEKERFGRRIGRGALPAKKANNSYQKRYHWQLQPRNALQYRQIDCAEGKHGAEDGEEEISIGHPVLKWRENLRNRTEREEKERKCEEVDPAFATRREDREDAESGEEQHRADRRRIEG